MSSLFEVVGIITCAILGIILVSIIYLTFIHPIFQAVSIMRYVLACEKVADPRCKVTLRVLWVAFKWGYEVGGHHSIRYHNRFGEWSGIGKWRVYENEDE